MNLIDKFFSFRCNRNEFEEACNSLHEEDVMDRNVDLLEIYQDRDFYKYSLARALYNDIFEIVVQNRDDYFAKQAFDINTVKNVLRKNGISINNKNIKEFIRRNKHLVKYVMEIPPEDPIKNAVYTAILEFVNVNLIDSSDLDKDEYQNRLDITNMR